MLLWVNNTLHCTHFYFMICPTSLQAPTFLNQGLTDFIIIFIIVIIIIIIASLWATGAIYLITQEIRMMGAMIRMLDKLFTSWSGRFRVFHICVMNSLFLHLPWRLVCTCQWFSSHGRGLSWKWRSLILWAVQRNKWSFNMCLMMVKSDSLTNILKSTVCFDHFFFVTGGDSYLSGSLSSSSCLFLKLLIAYKDNTDTACN